MNLWISLLLLAGMVAVTTLLAWLDARRRRPVPRHLKLSFLIPCYNDCATIGACFRPYVLRVSVMVRTPARDTVKQA